MINLRNGVTVEVVFPARATVTTVPVNLPGPPGPKGDPGQIRFSGQGPPGLLVGARPNDLYLDTSTGIVYKLT